MSDGERGNPIQLAVIVLLLVGGGWYFMHHYSIDGLDGVSVSAKAASQQSTDYYVSYRDAPALPSDASVPALPASNRADDENPFAASGRREVRPQGPAPIAPQQYDNLRIASWALDGFGPTKLANASARRNLARVVRSFDIVAIQQVASVERDLIPRLVEAINDGQARYDYVMGQPVGPSGRPEQLAFIFDKSKVLVDRRHTYTAADPDDQLAFEPLVAWFRAAQPSVQNAWTFSLVNVRIDLARAPSEVATLPQLLASVRRDGRSEDDVILMGLFQADDAYLLPTLGAQQYQAAVRALPTDLFGRYQTSNILIDSGSTSEYLGRGSAFDFARRLNLTTTEAETVTSQLPVYAEFCPIEGGL